MIMFLALNSPPVSESIPLETYFMYTQLTLGGNSILIFVEINFHVITMANKFAQFYFCDCLTAINMLN